MKLYEIDFSGHSSFIFIMKYQRSCKLIIKFYLLKLGLRLSACNVVCTINLTKKSCDLGGVSLTANHVSCYKKSIG